MDHIIFIKEELENILLIKENNYCFECSSNDNEWVSISYGILICLECAGKHRNLGVQISYVKSIYLDTWSIEQVLYSQFLFSISFFYFMILNFNLYFNL